jgi:predicted  nucleic acid-binding Zn-ribbon protein
MSDLRKAAQLMLDSVEQMLSGGEWYCARERADDLRAALQDEGTECQRPVCRLTRERDALRQIVEDFPPIETDLQEVSDRAHRLETQRDALLEALKLARPYISTYTVDGYHAEVKADAAIKSVEGVRKDLCAALAEPQRPLLTEEEIWDLFNDTSSYVSFARAIERKVRGEE